MLVVVDPADLSDYGRFPADIGRDWLGRWCHLSDADISLARRRTGDTTRLGFAVQLAPVRAVGTIRTPDYGLIPAPLMSCR